MKHHPLRSRRFAAPVAALCTLGLLVASCRSDDDSASDAPAPAATTAGDGTTADVGTTVEAGTAAGGAEAAEGAFPVSIENMYGTTVIESKPERVVSIGYTEGDFVLALGVTPVAIRDLYGDQPGGLLPWAAEAPAADDSIVVLEAAELNFEKIAALDPDLIVAMVSEIAQPEYDQLTAIAPVLAQTDDYVQYGTPWYEVQLTIGKALGLETEGQAIVDEVRGQIDAAAAAHPDCAGQTANFVVPEAEGTWYAYTDHDNRGRLLTELGFTIPQEIVDLAGDRFYAEGGAETVELIDADLVTYNVYSAEAREAVEAWTLWQSIPAVAAGRSLFLDDGLAGAMSFSTTLSLQYAIDGLVPQIESVLGS